MRLGASAHMSGLMITLHYFAMGLSNLHMSYQLDSSALDRIVFPRFLLLTLFTFGEALFTRFALFFIVYVFTLKMASTDSALHNRFE